MTHFIYEFHQVHLAVHRVCPNWFLSIWYVPCKPCAYLASRLELSLNRLNQAFTWASSPRSTTRCLQNGFLWSIRCQPCTYVAPKLTLSPNRPKQDSIWHTSSRSSIGCIQIEFKAYGTSMQTVHLSCIKISTISKHIEPTFHLSLFT